MSRIAIALFCVVLPLTVSSQILNAGFENWDSIENYEKPSNWNTNQSLEFERLEKDTVSVEGKYSVRLFSGTYSFFDVCESHLNTGLKLSQPYEVNHSLYLNYKLISDNSLGTAFLNVHLRVFPTKGGVEYLDTVISETTQEFTELELPLIHNAIDSISIGISGGGASSGIEDGCYSMSIAWIDNFRIAPSTLSAVRQLTNAPVSIYPNPSNGVIHVDGDWNIYSDYTVYSLLGTIVTLGNLTGPEIQLDEAGIFILVLRDPTHMHDPIVTKIIVQK